MNYLRGAVSAISAPYQYYKDLPPINPATLTGAIDVIVVRRPTEGGDVQLACSPFHVRFGKLQVLRPGEKKVNVAVNGNPIPYNMKIGDAGEAFFVFETEEDIPEDLVTSPILAATNPSEVSNVDVPTGRFGAKRDPDISPGESQEPDFLDLNAPSHDSSSEPPPSLTALREAGPLRKVAQTLPSPPLTPPLSGASPSYLLSRLMPKGNGPAEAVDELSRTAESDVHPPVIDYKPDITLDMAGYHADQAIDRKQSSERGSPDASTSSQASKSLSLEPQVASSSRPRKILSLDALPVQRATSEPPFDSDEQPRLDGAGLAGSPSRQYLWEWGNFPQPSPVQQFHPAFGSKGKKRMVMEQVGSPLELQEEPSAMASDVLRSHSVPPELEGSPPMVPVELPAERPAHMDSFGWGGELIAKSGDPTKLRVRIEGKTVDFELSVVDVENPSKTVFSGRDEVAAAEIFDKGKVTYRQFLDDESVLSSDRLVIRWTGGQYITRSDSSPLMDALTLWHETALANNFPSSPPSPTPHFAVDQPIFSEPADMKRAESEPPETSNKPTSSSWVRWWSRSGNQTGTKLQESRPHLRGSISSPVDNEAVKVLGGTDILKTLSAPPVGMTVVTPSQSSSSMSTIKFPTAETLDRSAALQLSKEKKYAKTLRLSSDQLKSLDLHTGPNTITFSLSTTGTPACTARIFVWDSTDQIVISDIDGTITKSDGLGHIFTMIGRDWTHLGVAKLYTDIARNGYKIMYLTSRAIGQADATRDYLKGIKQNDYQLPQGPVIMSPDRLIASLHREVIMRKPEVFKMACLRDIQRLFGEASRNPFYAGFGNRITDALSYRSVNVPSSRIFTIDSSGEVKMELLELAGYKSSYIHMTDLVDQIFPPINRKWATEYTDFNYWKAPMQDIVLPDLTPPSPALSARSDTSNQSTLARLRNFSLVSSKTSKQFSLPAPVTESRSHNAIDKVAKQADDVDMSKRLRQMSSFERLSNTLVALTSSSSSADSGASTSIPSRSSRTSSAFIDSGSEEEGDDIARGIDIKRPRRRSTTSMPGSLDDMHFGMGGDEEEFRRSDDDKYGAEGEDDEEESEVAEDAFDEDFLATGEMQNVPFL